MVYGHGPVSQNNIGCPGIMAEVLRNVGNIQTQMHVAPAANCPRLNLTRISGRRHGSCEHTTSTVGVPNLKQTVVVC